jgi:glycosyltransferase involved in cell wall biosynthesis
MFPPGVGHRLFFHGLVPPGDLLGRIAEHDVGLALEENRPKNKDLTVSNKILHYLVAGLAVIATDTRGQKEVAAAAEGAVRLCRVDDALSLAARIEELVAGTETLAHAKASALRAAEAQFSWERQVPTLVGSVEKVLYDVHRTVANA